MRIRTFGLTLLATVAPLVADPPAAGAQGVHVGDFDEDGDVDVDDYGVFVNGFQQSCFFGGPPSCEQDFDQDGDLDVDDFGVFVDGFQRFPPVVETPIADFDEDGDVDTDDFGVFLVGYLDPGPIGGPPYRISDFDRDGDTDLNDFGVFVDGFQRFSPTALIEGGGSHGDSPGIPGDFDGNGCIGSDDFGVFVHHYQLSPQGGPPFAPADFDEDGDVDTDDFGVYVFSFLSYPPPPIPIPGCLFYTHAAVVAVPAPTCAALAFTAAGAFAVTMRRRR